LQIAAGQIDAYAIAPDMIEGAIDGNVGSAFANRNDQLDFVVKVFCLWRIGNCHAIVHDGICRLQKEKRRFAVRIPPHLTGVRCIVAANADDTTHRKACS
jgi:hypothetical protein